MEIEVKNRKLLFPESTVFDADENAAVWTFVFPELVSERAVEQLSGTLLVATDTGYADKISATRTGTAFTVTLPAGLFNGANSAMVQFALTQKDFAWHSDIVAAEVVRCLNPEQAVIDAKPTLITELQLRLTSVESRVSALESDDGVMQTMQAALSSLQTKQAAQDAKIDVLSEKAEELQTHIDDFENVKNVAIQGDAKATALISGTVVTKKAECDASGNVITATYATKQDLSENCATKESEQIAALANSKATALISGDVTAKKAECDASGNGITATYATKTELQKGIDNLFTSAPEGYTSVSDIAEKVQAAHSAATSASATAEAVRSDVDDLKSHQTWFTVDISAYVWDSLLDYGALNSKLASIKNGLPAGVRGNIVFSNVEGDTGFLSSAADIVWQNGMNYHFLKEETPSVGQLVLNGVEDVSFYNFHVSAVCEKTVLVMTNCKNVTFENCSFINEMYLCANFENCDELRFDNCYFEMGTWNAYNVISIKDTGTTTHRIVLENCYIHHRNWVAISFSDVSNDNFFIRLENVRLLNNTRISQSNCATSGHGTISFSVDQSDLASTLAVNEVANTYALGTRRVALEAGQAYALAITGNTTLLLPETDGLTRSSVIVYAEVTAADLTVDVGADLWENGEKPTLSRAGHYRISYDFNPIAKTWQGSCAYFAAPTEA